jgi:hypothetical protein
VRSQPPHSDEQHNEELQPPYYQAHRTAVSAPAAGSRSRPSLPRRRCGARWMKAGLWSKTARPKCRVGAGAVGWRGEWTWGALLPVRRPWLPPEALTFAHVAA